MNKQIFFFKQKRVNTIRCHIPSAEFYRERKAVCPGIPYGNNQQGVWGRDCGGDIAETGSRQLRVCTETSSDIEKDGPSLFSLFSKVSLQTHTQNHIYVFHLEVLIHLAYCLFFSPSAFLEESIILM